MAKANKKKGFSLQGFDVQAYRQSEAYVQAVDVLYSEAVKDFAKVASGLKFNPNKPFSFNDYPAAKRKADEIINGLSSNMKSVVVEGTKKQWLFACQKNDEFLNHILNTSKIAKKTLAKYQDKNLDALSTFQTRKVNGLDLSQRIWNYTGQMKTQMELGIDIALGDGRSANALSRDLRQYLVDPDKLFRRVRDKHGNLVLSKNAKAFHPGQGKYRSSYKNAMRLTRSEINMAYRESDQLRWDKLDFIVGYEVKLSNNHTLNGKPFVDICDDLKGKYPKTFKFTGWHPQCYSNDTEVMTDNGWKLFKDLNKTDLIFSLNPDTKQPEYVKYVNYFAYKKDGKMIRFSNKSLDLLVTEDHKMVYMRKSDRATILTDKVAENYSKFNGGLYRSSEYKSDECDYITIGKHFIPFDLYAEFMAYYLSEGSVSWTRKHQFSIAQSKEKHLETYTKIEKLLSKLPFKYTACKERFYLYDQDMCSYLMKFGKSINKHVPYELKTASPRQISIFLDAYVVCDGHSRKCKSFIGSRGNRFSSEKQERVFFSSSDQMASDIGEMLVKIGHRPSYDLQKTKGIAQTHRNGVYVGNKDLWRIRECYSQTSTEFNKEYIDYSGYVYDIELEKNHILYVRRNGKCVWGSNCRCHANPILSDPDEFNTDELNELKAAIKGTEYKKFASRNTVTDVPDNFKEWVKNNAEKSNGWKSQPFFIRDNFKGGVIDNGLSLNTEKQIVKTEPISERTPNVVKIQTEQRPEYKKIVEAEDKIRMNRSFETAVVFDESGNEVYRKKGAKSSVSFYDNEIQLFKNKIFTHNHPGGWKFDDNSIKRAGSSFSSNDVVTAIRSDMKEIRAVTPHYTFALKRPSGGWGMSVQAAKSAIMNIEADVRSDFMAMLRNRGYKDIDIKRAESIHWHIVWKRFSSKYNIEYTKAKTRG